jgi:hypothetical protein
MALVPIVSGTSRLAYGAPEARSRRDLLRLTRTVVAVKAPRWRREGAETVVVRDPNLTPDDVRMAFDEICEKLRVDGVRLEVEGEGDELLRAIFRKAPLRR